jgi:dimeric dUTPase (all-alpha-NTP-PPase superfamily)
LSGYDNDTEGRLRMNLSKLFELQRELDERIVREKGVEGQDLLPMKILALQVELGELANEWRGFKYWSNDREPCRVRFVYNESQDEYEQHDPLLEEYVDCLHFILSIGLTLGQDKREELPELLDIQKDIDDTLTAFAECFNRVSDLQMFRDTVDFDWVDLMRTFIRLGKLLGFTWDEIEQAYLTNRQPRTPSERLLSHTASERRVTNGTE